MSSNNSAPPLDESFRTPAESTSCFLPGTQIQYAWFKRKAEWLLENAIERDGCLISHLTPNAGGYIPVSFGRMSKWRAHRVVFFADNPDADQSLMVLHKCDVRDCINPAHLFLGTAQDNTNDMVIKERAQFIQPRTDHLHRENIIQLRKLGYSHKKIASTLFISVSTVTNYLSPRGPYYVGPIS